MGARGPADDLPTDGLIAGDVDGEMTWDTRDRLAPKKRRASSMNGLVVDGAVIRRPPRPSFPDKQGPTRERSPPFSSRWRFPGSVRGLHSRSVWTPR